MELEATLKVSKEYIEKLEKRLDSKSKKKGPPSIYSSCEMRISIDLDADGSEKPDGAKSPRVEKVPKPDERMVSTHSERMLVLSLPPSLLGLI